MPHRKYKVKVNLGQEDDEDPEVSLMKLYTQIGNDEVFDFFYVLEKSNCGWTIFQKDSVKSSLGGLFPRTCNYVYTTLESELGITFLCSFSTLHPICVTFLGLTSKNRQKHVFARMAIMAQTVECHIQFGLSTVMFACSTTSIYP